MSFVGVLSMGMTRIHITQHFKEPNNRAIWGLPVLVIWALVCLWEELVPVQGLCRPLGDIKMDASTAYYGVVLLNSQ